MAIVKKLLVLVSIVAIVVGVVYSIVLSKDKTNAIDIALSVSGKVVGVYKGDTDYKSINSYLGINAMEELDTFIRGVKDRNNVAFNLTDYYNSINIGVSEDVADDVLDPVSEEALNYITDESYLVDDASILPIVNDEAIYTENGKDYIKVKDLVFKDDLATIDYSNTTLLVSRGDVPLTYDSMIKNKDFRFIIKDYSVVRRKDSYNVVIDYISLTKKNRLKVSIEIVKNIVEGIKIDLLEGE